MDVVVIGMGVQGEKRARVARDFGNVITVDPLAGRGDYSSISEVPIENYSTACVCVPDSEKAGTVDYLVGHEKHCLIEKPFELSNARLKTLEMVAAARGVVVYTAYNHRFEPSLVEVKKIVDSGFLGEPYLVRGFYGNGTAQLVKSSPWKDGPSSSIIKDLGSHLVDITEFLLGRPNETKVLSAQSNAFETNNFDWASWQLNWDGITVQQECTYLCWKNRFELEVIGSKGSVRVDGLQKWGGSRLQVHKRVFPSGVPDISEKRYSGTDPTWKEEYEFFISRLGSPPGRELLSKDVFISELLNNVWNVCNSEGAVCT
ncbi:Gfo/Idh/MocA family oxidoreductase [Litorivicinus sp.]|nr:Gfo/Idh/MocA family oxidoreductase [Litorivicinus sp.]